jgi:hypothetical protein
MTARGNDLLAAFFCEALLKDFHIVSSFNYNLEPFHGSFLKHIVLALWHTIEQDDFIFWTSGLSQLVPQARVCCCRRRNRSIMPGVVVSWTSTLRDVGGLLS